MRIYKSVNPFLHRKRFKHIFHKNRRYSLMGLKRIHARAVLYVERNLLRNLLLKWSSQTPECSGLNESASLLIADNLSLLVTSSFGKANTCFLQEGVIPQLFFLLCGAKSWPTVYCSTFHPLVFFLFQNSMMFPIRHPIIILKANTFDAFFSINKL